MLELIARDERGHFQLVLDLLIPVALAMYHLERPLGDPPTSRDRNIALTTIERLEGYIAAGVITFSNPARREMLFELLTEEARVDLWQHRPKPVAYPILHSP